MKTSIDHPTIAKGHPALFKGEKPTKATLPNGDEITVLIRPGGCVYGALGRSANFGGCGETLSPELHHMWIPLKNGKSLSFFANETTGLIVLDVVNRRGDGGVEYLRRTIEEIKA